MSENPIIPSISFNIIALQLPDEFQEYLSTLPEGMDSFSLLLHNSETTFLIPSEVRAQYEILYTLFQDYLDVAIKNALALLQDLEPNYTEREVIVNLFIQQLYETTNEE